MTSIARLAALRTEYWRSGQGQTFWKDGARWEYFGDSVYGFIRMRSGIGFDTPIPDTIRVFIEKFEAFVRQEAGYNAAKTRADNVEESAEVESAKPTKDTVEEKPRKLRVVTKQPKVVFSSPENCRVLMRGWPVVGVCRKPLDQELKWWDISVRVEWEALEKYPVRNTRMLTDTEKRSARRRIFAVMSGERERVLKKALKKAREPEFF